MTEGKSERDRDGDQECKKKKKKEGEAAKEREVVRPHDLHIGVILSSEELVAAVCSHHVFIHCELDLSPELAVLLRAHGQSEKYTPTPGKRN